MTRASLMILALLILHVLLGALCLVVARHGERSRALHLWGVGLLCYAVGLLTTLLTAILESPAFQKRRSDPQLLAKSP